LCRISHLSESLDIDLLSIEYPEEVVSSDTMPIDIKRKTTGRLNPQAGRSS
jgi:hypothetical protein